MVDKVQKPSNSEYKKKLLTQSVDEDSYKTMSGDIYVVLEVLFVKVIVTLIYQGSEITAKS
jgi:hypothetical protein